MTHDVDPVLQIRTRANCAIDPCPPSIRELAVRVLQAQAELTAMVEDLVTLVLTDAPPVRPVPDDRPVPVDWADQRVWR